MHADMPEACWQTFAVEEAPHAMGPKCDKMLSLGTLIFDRMCLLWLRRRVSACRK